MIEKPKKRGATYLRKDMVVLEGVSPSSVFLNGDNKGQDMKCHWCEREPNNDPELILDGNYEGRLVVFCNRCRKANDEANDILNQPERSKREDLSQIDSLGDFLERMRCSELGSNVKREVQ